MFLLSPVILATPLDAGPAPQHQLDAILGCENFQLALVLVPDTDEFSYKIFISEGPTYDSIYRMSTKTRFTLLTLAIGGLLVFLANAAQAAPIYSNGY